ncbi:MAG: hypothetical protein QGG71_08860 [Pirellulaceae bacterium]|nr:hypothetical protein [Pirellulaceae bacterium]
MSRGFEPFVHSDQVVSPESVQSYNGKRITELAELWLDGRQRQAKRGDLKLKQWSEDKTQLDTFCNFIRVNYPAVTKVAEIDAGILNVYRAQQWHLVDYGKFSKTTLRKRLRTVVQWLRWLVDENLLADLPKKLSRYAAGVQLDQPKPVFWTVDEIKLLVKSATERTRLYIMLALNLGYTQIDIATLDESMIDWESGIIERERHKTGVLTKAKLWPSTLWLLLRHRSQGRGPVLLNQNGGPLLVERINDKDNLIVNDAIRLAFDRRKRAAGFKTAKRSFKHFRKTAANEIEKVAPHLTGSFLGHSEKGTKRFYVRRHYDELYEHTDRLESLFGFDA